MWSPLKVHHPRANSLISPVPMTKPPSCPAISINIWVLSRAWAFSYVRSCVLPSCPISWKCCITAGVISISLDVIPRSSISLWAFVRVRLLVPKPGIVTPMIPSRGKPIKSKVATVLKRASVESRPPEIPITTFFAPV